MENKHLHLKMIQNIITRLSIFSFAFKVINLIAMLFMILNSLNIDGNDYKPFFFIVVICYFFDCFYLKQERAFRYLYAVVVDKDDKYIDFNMMNAYVYADKYSLLKMALTKNLVVLYGGSMCIIMFLDYL